MPFNSLKIKGFFYVFINFISLFIKMKFTNFFSLIFIGLISNSVASQELNPFHQSLVNQVTQQNIQNNLSDFVSFGIKETGTNAQANTLQWLVSKYQSWGYTNIEQQAVNVFGQTSYNLIVTKQGTVYPDQYIIIDGHYDTINGVGANDNGSGTTVLLETARILKDIPTEYSIKFIHFAGEELGLIGSQQYVENIVIPQDLDIKLVFNIDQVGGVAGDINDTITCERDESSPNSNNSQSALVTDQLSTLMQLYSSLNTHISYAYGSDYVPFQEAGYVITGLYETNESPYPHSPQDTLENMDPEFVFEVTKGALGAMCFFAKAYENMNVNDSDMSALEIYPNPANEFIQINLKRNKSLNYKLLDTSGKVVLSGHLTELNSKISTSSLLNGNYILNLKGENVKYSQKIIIKH